MVNPTAISTRIEACIEHAQVQRFEDCLLNLFPAIDKTAKIRYPKTKNAERMKKFLEDQHDIVSLIACNNVLNITAGGRTFPEVIYKFARCALMHEGELDQRISFNNETGLMIRNDYWNLPPSYILGLCIGVVTAKENKDEWINPTLTCKLWNDNYTFNQLWGKPELVHRAINNFASAR